MFYIKIDSVEVHESTAGVAQRTWHSAHSDDKSVPTPSACFINVFSLVNFSNSIL